MTMKGSQELAPLRVTAASLGVPDAFESIEYERDTQRIAGEYSSAAKLQDKLEKRKEEEDCKHLQVLADKNEIEAHALERSQDEEYHRFVHRWDEHMSDLAYQANQQEAQLYERQGRERQVFRQTAEASVPKPKWSSDLLNQRKIEEHLARQKEFVKAAQVKAKADMMEMEELRQNQDCYWAKVALEESKMLQRQSREMDALRSRTSALRDEALVNQRKELEKLSKKFQVARIELSKSQGMARVDLDWALKGWFNPRKAGLGPSPLIPASPMHVSLMTPALKLSVHRDAGASPNRRGPRSGASSGPPSPHSLGRHVRSDSVSDMSTAPSRFEGSGAGAGLEESGGAAAASGASSGLILPSLPQALQPKSESPFAGARSGSGGLGRSSPGHSSSGHSYMQAKLGATSPKGSLSPKGSFTALSPKGSTPRSSLY